MLISRLLVAIVDCRSIKARREKVSIVDVSCPVIGKISEINEIIRIAIYGERARAQFRGSLDTKMIL